MLTNENMTGDIELVEHMQTVSTNYMNSRPIKDAEGIRMGFDRQSKKITQHMHLHIMMMPFKHKKLEANFDQKYVKPQEVVT